MGVFYDCIISYNIFIPMKDIIKTEFRVDQRVLKKDCSDFLVITCNIDGIETEILFQGKAASIANSNILKKIIDNNKNNTSNAKNDSGDITMDIPEQIRKLSELKEQGILTEEEFNAKKSELLSRL